MDKELQDLVLELREQGESEDYIRSVVKEWNKPSEQDDIDPELQELVTELTDAGESDEYINEVKLEWAKQNPKVEKTEEEEENEWAQLQNTIDKEVHRQAKEDYVGDEDASTEFDDLLLNDIDSIQNTFRQEGDRIANSRNAENAFVQEGPTNIIREDLDENVVIDESKLKDPKYVEELKNKYIDIRSPELKTKKIQDTFVFDAEDYSYDKPADVNKLKEVNSALGNILNHPEVARFLADKPEVTAPGEDLPSILDRIYSDAEIANNGMTKEDFVGMTDPNTGKRYTFEQLQQLSEMYQARPTKVVEDLTYAELSKKTPELISEMPVVVANKRELAFNEEALARYKKNGQYTKEQLEDLDESTGIPKVLLADRNKIYNQIYEDETIKNDVIPRLREENKENITAIEDEVLEDFGFSRKTINKATKEQLAQINNLIHTRSSRLLDDSLKKTQEFRAIEGIYREQAGAHLNNQMARLGIDKFVPEVMQGIPFLEDVYRSRLSQKSSLAYLKAGGHELDLRESHEELESLEGKDDNEETRYETTAYVAGPTGMVKSFESHTTTVGERKEQLKEAIRFSSEQYKLNAKRGEELNKGLQYFYKPELLDGEVTFRDLTAAVGHQVYNSAVAAALPVLGTITLEGGHIYRDNLESLYRQRFGKVGPNGMEHDKVVRLIEEDDTGITESGVATVITGALDTVGIYSVIGSIVKAPAKKLAKNLIKGQFNKFLAYTKNKGVQIGKAQFSEWITEQAQEGVQQYSGYHLTGNRGEFNIQEIKEAGAQAIVATGAITTTSIAFSDINKEITSRLDPESRRNAFKNVLKDIDTKVADGSMTEEEGEFAKQYAEDLHQAHEQIPADMPSFARHQYAMLLARKEALTRAIQGKDDSLIIKEKEQLEAIDTKLEELGTEYANNKKSTKTKPDSETSKSKKIPLDPEGSYDETFKEGVNYLEITDEGVTIGSNLTGNKYIKQVNSKNLNIKDKSKAHNKKISNAIKDIETMTGNTIAIFVDAQYDSHDKAVGSFSLKRLSNGQIQPSIVLPAWVLGQSTDVVVNALKHEMSHGVNAYLQLSKSFSEAKQFHNLFADVYNSKWGKRAAKTLKDSYSHKKGDLAWTDEYVAQAFGDIIVSPEYKNAKEGDKTLFGRIKEFFRFMFGRILGIGDDKRAVAAVKKIERKLRSGKLKLTKEGIVSRSTLKVSEFGVRENDTKTVFSSFKKAIEESGNEDAYTLTDNEDNKTAFQKYLEQQVELAVQLRREGFAIISEENLVDKLNDLIDGETVTIDGDVEIEIKKAEISKDDTAEKFTGEIDVDAFIKKLTKGLKTDKKGKPAKTQVNLDTLDKWIANNKNAPQEYIDIVEGSRSSIERYLKRNEGTKQKVADEGLQPQERTQEEKEALVDELTSQVESIEIPRQGPLKDLDVGKMDSRQIVLDTITGLGLRFTEESSNPISVVYNGLANSVFPNHRKSNTSKEYKTPEDYNYAVQQAMASILMPMMETIGLDFVKVDYKRHQVNMYIADEVKFNNALDAANTSRGAKKAKSRPVKGKVDPYTEIDHSLGHTLITNESKSPVTQPSSVMDDTNMAQDNNLTVNEDVLGVVDRNKRTFDKLSFAGKKVSASKKKKMRNQRDTRIEIANDFIGESFQVPHNRDFRSRYQQRAGTYTYSGDKTVLSYTTFDTSEAEALGHEGVDALLIGLATSWGKGVGQTKEERRAWALDNVDMIISTGLDPNKDKTWQKADAWYEFLPLSMELAKAVTSKEGLLNYKSHQAVWIDFTTNAIQHIAGLTHSKEAAKYANIIPGIGRFDYYLDSGKGFFDHVIKNPTEEQYETFLRIYKQGQEFDAEFEKVKDNKRKNADFNKRYNAWRKENGGKFNKSGHRWEYTGDIATAAAVYFGQDGFKGAERSVSKLGSMVKGYGSGVPTSVEQMGNDMSTEHKYYDLGYTRVFSGWAVPKIYDTADTLIPANKNFEAGAKGIGKFFADKKEPIVYTTPTGFIVYQYPQMANTRRYKIKLPEKYKGIGDKNGYITIKTTVGPKGFNAVSQVTSTVANMIQGIGDASHLVMIIRKAYDEGIPIMIIHDNISTIPSKLARLEEIAKEAYIEMYKQPVLKNTLTEIFKNYPDQVDYFYDLMYDGSFEINDSIKDAEFMIGAAPALSVVDDTTTAPGVKTAEDVFSDEKYSLDAKKLKRRIKKESLESTANKIKEESKKC